MNNAEQPVQDALRQAAFESAVHNAHPPSGRPIHIDMFDNIGE
jgi:hypothetical protein